VPNNEEIDAVTPEGIADQLQEGMALICEKAESRGVEIAVEEFDTHSLITPACGLGPTTPEIADKVLPVLVETSRLLRG
jgi:hypothetical protein